MGAEVASAEVEGLPAIDPEQLRRLNLWISAGGAWRASTLSYWDGEDVLCNVLLGALTDFPRGTAGGGRATRAPVLPLRWYKSESLQGEFRL